MSRVLLEKLTVTQLVKITPAIYGARRFITVFTRARRWTLSWASWIRSTPSHSGSLRSIWMLSSSLRLFLPPHVFWPKVRKHSSSLQCVLHVPPTPIFIDLITLILFIKEQKSCNFICVPLIPFLLGRNVPLTSLSSDTVIYVLCLMRKTTHTW